MNTQIDTGEAEERLSATGADIYALLSEAGRVRQEVRGNKVHLCSVLNARCGGCPEDCAFCAQSAHNRAAVERFPLVSSDEMVRAAREAVACGAQRYGIVTSGKAVRKDGELNRIAAAVKTIARAGEVLPCASLGTLSRESLFRLKEAGLTRYHHNLETARSFFSEICTTRSYDESVQTIETAKELGLATCCGGIFGLGESLAQRVELLDTIRQLDVDSVPLNFLNPIPGTPLQHLDELTPLECLKIVAVARLMMPHKEIRVCGGREVNFRDLQSWIFLAGADGIMVGGYLTTSGRVVEDDLRMITDCGLEVAVPETAVR